MYQNRLRIILLLFLIPLFSCSTGEKQEEGAENVDKLSWPVFRGDPGLSGVSDSELPENPDLLWSFKTEYEILSSPVIGFGKVYIGSNDGNVYALNLSDGSKVWQFDTGDDVEAPPLLVDQTIYVGSLNGDFFAIDAHTGKLSWKYEIQSEIMGSANWVKIPDTGEKLIMVGSYDNKMYGFGAESGELKWTYETGYYINGAPATDGEVVVFGGCDEILHIVSVFDGSKKGEVLAGSYIAGSAALVDNRAYLGHYGNKLVCIDLVEQEIVWEYQDEKNGDAFFSSPAIGKDRVIIGSRDYSLHCVDRETGQKIWTFRTLDEVDSSPVIAGDKVVFGSADGRIYIVNLLDGKKIWSYEIGEAVSSCPAVAGGKIVIGAEDGRVYTFGESK